MAEILQFTFSGLTVGAIYAVVALSFTLIYNSSDVVNFAQGEFVMIGGMVTVFAAAAGIPLPLAAQLVGINTSAVIGLSFMISAAIGAVGGILAAPITLTNYDVGTMLALKAFAAAMLGGMGNPIGAVVGGLTLGLLEAFGAGYISSQYKDAVAFIVILVVLFAMPQGMFGSSKVERV